MATLKVKFQILISFVYFFGCFCQPSESVCNIDLQLELRNKAPLLTQFEDTVLPDGTSFLLPRMNSVTMTLNSGDVVKFFCPGSDNRFNLSGIVENVNHFQGHCDSGSNFYLNERSYPLSDIRCTQEAESSVKHIGSCNGGNKRLQIGFSIAQTQFLNLIDICFNENALTPSYVNYTLAEGIELRQITEELDNPDKRDYFNTLQNSPQSYYTCSNQQAAVGSILGSQSLGTKYIVCSDPSNFLVKTYLVPCSDFVYESQQKSSKYYINTIPMWHSITNGNWGKLEEEIRLYASNISRESSDLIIYTGTWGVTTLTNNRYVKKPIYLANGDKLPVPQWVWKVVYEPQVKEGIVFILINNPYRLKFAQCRCVCPQTKWTLEWNRMNKTEGYIYCCTVDNFRTIYPALPQFEVTGLLKKDRPYHPFIVDVEAQK